MGKKKSAVLLVIYTLLIALLCVICLVSFPYGTDGIYEYTSILRMTATDADLGHAYGANGENGAYLGGGYSAVYYPEGVISAKEYEATLGGFTEEQADERAEYEADHIAYAAGSGSAVQLYLERETVCNDDGTVSDAFREKFAAAVETIRARYELLRADGARVEVRDDYTIAVFLPELLDGQAGVSAGEAAAIAGFSYTGELSIRYGTSESDAKDVFPIHRGETIEKYVRSVKQLTSGETTYLAFRFTTEGRDALADATADAAETAGTMYFYVGDTQMLSLTVDAAYDQDELYISGGFTSETGRINAIVLNSALKGSQDDLSFTVADVYRHHAQYGDRADMMLYIAFAVCFVAMMAVFFVRYRRLAFAHLYTYLLFLFVVILCVWAIPFLYLSIETFAAFMLVSVLLAMSNAVTFESAKKEYALGKTMASSVKTGYKKCFWKLFDLHVVVAAIGFLAYAVALPGLQAFAFVLGLAAVFSGIASLLVNRFTWAIMMALAKNKGAFCNFKREDTDDE